MSTGGPFVAQLLRTSAVGYAGLSASLLLERQPEIGARYAPDALSAWKDQLRQWLLDLSAAVEVGEPKLFESRVSWTRHAFLVRRASVDDLRAALEALRDVLRERLPADSAEPVAAAVDGALAAVAAPSTARGDAVAPPDRSALAYLETILAGNPREAIDRLLAAVDDGTPVRDAYLHVLLPAQREAGRMWHANELSIAEEHVVTETTRRAMALLRQRARAAPSTGKTVLLACVAGNVHDIGIRAIADFFEMAGWRAIHLGADVPAEEIARSVEFFDADLVVLAATLALHVTAAQRAISRIRAMAEREVRVIVGGPVFDAVPDLWRKVGADGHSSRVEDTEPLGSRLTGS